MRVDALQSGRAPAIAAVVELVEEELHRGAIARVGMQVGMAAQQALRLHAAAHSAAREILAARRRRRAAPRCARAGGELARCRARGVVADFYSRIFTISGARMKRGFEPVERAVQRTVTAASRPAPAPRRERRERSASTSRADASRAVRAAARARRRARTGRVACAVGVLGEALAVGVAEHVLEEQLVVAAIGFEQQHVRGRVALLVVRMPTCMRD